MIEMEGEEMEPEEEDNGERDFYRDTLRRTEGDLPLGQKKKDKKVPK